VKISASEWKRKAVHAGMGLFALALRWLTWEQAALCAVAALLFNLFVIPRFGRGLYRATSGHRDAGIVAYPAMVLVLILICREYYLPIAAAVWAMMAFGDPAASIFGTVFGGPVLPWNPQKTWIGFFANWAFGGVGSVFVYAFTARGLTPLAAAIFMGGAGLFAFLESVRSGIDDNLVPALPTLFFIAWVGLGLQQPPLTALSRPPLWLAVLVNAAVAAAAQRARAVSLSGAVGGAVVGTVILAAGGAGAYAVLWSFFLAGTVASRWGYREKAKRGTAQARGGRRGAEHVAANCFVAALLALLSHFQARGWGIAFAACFAAALADTLGTEFGSLYGRRAFSPLGRGGLAVGTPGAVSWPGLAAAAGGAAFIAVIGRLAGLVPAAGIWVVAAAGFLGALAESAANDLGRRLGFKIDHEFANAMNTFAGAAIAAEIWLSLAKGGLYVPLEG
jgi:uncharacterized protein (TIGR00297 family)